MTCVYTKTISCIHKHRSVYTHVCVYTNLCIYTSLCVYTNVHLCIHTTVYVYTHVCHLHKFVYTQVSVYTHLRSVYTHKYELCTRLQLTASRSQRVWAPQVVITRLLAEEDQGWLSKLDGEVLIGKDRNVNKAILNSAAALAGMAMQQPTTVNQT